MKEGKSMAIKGCKSIAEYAIRKWLKEQDFAMEHFKLVMRGAEGILSDENGDTVKLVYESGHKQVYMEE